MFIQGLILLFGPNQIILHSALDGRNRKKTFPFAFASSHPVWFFFILDFLDQKIKFNKGNVCARKWKIKTENLSERRLRYFFFFIWPGLVYDVMSIVRERGSSVSLLVSSFFFDYLILFFVVNDSFYRSLCVLFCALCEIYQIKRIYCKLFSFFVEWRTLWA